MPGIIPVAGQLDDAAVILLTLRLALNGLPEAERTAAVAGVGLVPSDLEVDLKTIGSTYAWIGRQGARLASHATRALARSGRNLARRWADRAVTR